LSHPTSGHDNSSPRWLQWLQQMNIPNLAESNQPAMVRRLCREAGCDV
jgi:hypothetical protein